MKIGIFSGSFNPIHMGHLILGNYVVENTDIDQVWYVVTPHNPWKEEDALLDEDLRLEMVKLATKPYEKLLASDFEFSLPRPSYTANTLRALKEKHPEHEYSLIIGADNWNAFSDWKNYDEIISNHPILVYPRLGHELSTIPKKLNNTVKILSAPIIEISSTTIRENIKENKNIRPHLPPEVYSYIVKNGLYNK